MHNKNDEKCTTKILKKYLFEKNADTTIYSFEKNASNTQYSFEKLAKRILECYNKCIREWNYA